MYSLYAPILDTNRTLRNLLKEVLGYTDDEIKILEAEHFGRNIVNNVTIEQAKKITEIFGGNDFTVYLNNGLGLDGLIAWNALGIFLSDEPPKSHYCDEPLVSREHLADLSIPKKVDPPIEGFIYDAKPTAKCPTCSSTNIKKISATSKIVNTALFGLLGTKRHKMFKCNNCGYEW